MTLFFFQSSDRISLTPIALNKNIESGDDRTSLLVGVRSHFTYADRSECEC